jgi:predicted pyridoxine 5'-phosphate oxidase superfamily flavin-nucleotide-binding protein
MIKLTDEMRENVDNALANSFPCILATASKDGVPGLGFRGSMMVYDDEHLAYWERSPRGQLEHIEENPRVTVMFRNHQTRLGWRFYGTVTIHGPEDPLREKVWKRVVEREKAQDPEKKGVAVLVRVNVVRDIAPRVLQSRD